MTIFSWGRRSPAAHPPRPEPMAVYESAEFFHVPLDGDLAPSLDGMPELSPASRDTWLVFAPQRAQLNPRLARIAGDIAWRRPDVDILYGDEVVGADDFVLKPAANPALLLAYDYIGLPILIRGSAYHRLGGVRGEMRSAAMYDFCLRGLQEGLTLERATEVLARYPGPRPRPRLEHQRAALEGALERSARRWQVLDGRQPGTFQARAIFDDPPPVTLLVPTRQTAGGRTDAAGRPRPHVIGLLESLAASSWPMDRLRVLIGDDLADDTIYRGHQWPFAVERVVTERPASVPFNYAAKMNALWRRAETDFVVLMNDDLEVRSPDWIEALITFAQEEDVGAVGARLLYPDGAIQHAGIACGLFGTCAHPWAGVDAGAGSYGDWAEVHRDWSAVTGAVLATRRSVLQATNGLDERFSLEFNDLDLCLRMRALGYRVVYTPFAELTHHAKASRGTSLPPGDEVNLFVKRWSRAIEDDPMFHPGLDKQRFDLQPRRDVMAQRLHPFSRRAA